MRWPWVSRLVFDVVSQERDRWMGIATEMQQQMLAMKREGFTAAPKPLPQASPKASPSDEAIAMRAGSNGMLRAHLTRWRDKERSLPDAPDENKLAERILRWTDPDGDE